MEKFCCVSGSVPDFSILFNMLISGGIQSNSPTCTLDGESPFRSSLFLFKTISAVPGSFLLRTHLGLTLSHCREDAGVPFIQSAKCKVTWTDTSNSAFASFPTPTPSCFLSPLYSMLPTTACLENQPASPSRCLMLTKTLLSAGIPQWQPQTSFSLASSLLCPFLGRSFSMADIL